jgi:hypothetical protein
MKKIISILSLGCLCLLCLNSCFFEEENLFSSSAAKRTNEILQLNYEVLTSSPNGWVLNYFPTAEQEGYTFLMKFDTTGTVKIAAKNRWYYNNQYRDSTSGFQLIADNGPVLTFNTNNYLLHFFSNPEDLPSTKDIDEGGRGLEGDYEFIIMNTTDDEILLKGKKRGVFMDLRRLPEDQDWREYFTKLDDNNVFMFNKNVPQIRMNIGDSWYTLDNGASHIFAAVPEGGDPIGDVENIPFVVTDYGIRFAKPFKKLSEEGKGVSKFALSEDGNSLVCVDEGSNAKIIGPELLPFFFKSIDIQSLRWTIQHGDGYMSPEVKTIYDRIANAFIDKKLTLDQISYMYSGRNNTDAVYFAPAKGTGGYFFFEKEQISEGVKYVYKQTSDNNGKVLNGYDGVAEMVNILSNSFKFEYYRAPELCPTQIKLTSISSPNIWFTVYLQ